MTPRDVLMRMALRLAERGDADGAAEALRGVLAMRGDDAAPPSDGPTAESYAAFARRIGCSTRHVRTLDQRGAIACVGVGRGRRVLVDESIAMMRGARPARDAASDAGAAWARRRGSLRVVSGGE